MTEALVEVQPATAAWRAILAGLCANMVGVGLARFAYTPLIPVLIAAGWFRPAAAAYLGAANLAGYLLGALLAGRMARHAGAAFALRAMMLLASASFFACALPLSFAWYFLWRFASGLAGGALMALAAAAVLPCVAAHRRGVAGGAMFTGVGLGMAASGTLVPLLLRLGLPLTWCGLGVISSALTLIAWRGWPADPRDGRPGGRQPGEAPAAQPARRHLPRTPTAAVALYAEYALIALGLVPHMVFLVDFIARGLGRGVASGAFYWVLAGLGAMAGPLIGGRSADRFGFRLMLRLAILAQALCVGLLAVAESAAALALSSLVVGALIPGVVPLVLGRIHELVREPGEPQRRAWGWCTIAFALGQAAGGYGFSWIFATTGGGYRLLFALAAAAFALALAIDLAAGLTRRRRASS